MILAAKHGHLEIVKTLLANGANLNYKNSSNTTALTIAQQNGHVQIVNLIKEIKSKDTVDALLLRTLYNNPKVKKLLDFTSTFFIHRRK